MTECPSVTVPSRWLVDNRDLLPDTRRDGRRARALDVASGRGRHALWLAATGFDTDAVDRDPDATAALLAAAAGRGLSVTARVGDLERPETDLGEACYDVIVVFRYLHRPLFAALRRALRDGGVLVYETFTTAQAACGKPSNPAFLLEPAELPRLVAPLQVLRAREGRVEGAMVAAVVAQKVPSGSSPP
jgi:tellurite methyltransferase